MSLPSGLIFFLDFTYETGALGAVAGAFGEFVASPRLDDQASVAVLTEALVGHATAPGALDADADVTVFAAFDHEEIGSESAHGAGSPVIGDVVERIHRGLRAGAAAPDAAASDAAHPAAATRRLTTSTLHTTSVFGCDALPSVCSLRYSRCLCLNSFRSSTAPHRHDSEGHTTRWCANQS